VPDVDGSPMMIAVNPPKYAIICAVVIPLTALDENIVTVHPSATASAASTDDEPPLTLLGKTSTEPEHVVDALAGADLAAAAATASTAALAATDAGTVMPPKAIIGASRAESARRADDLLRAPRCGH
jgi:hypothetical protein